MDTLVFYSFHTHFLLVLALPPLEVELRAPSNGTVGGSLTLECSVTHVPHLIVAPRVELVGPEGTVVANTTGFNVAHTLSPLMASQSGQAYYCQTQLQIEAIDVSRMSQSNTYTLNVLSKSLTSLGCTVCSTNTLPMNFLTSSEVQLSDAMVMVDLESTQLRSLPVSSCATLSSMPFITLTVVHSSPSHDIPWV